MTNANMNMKNIDPTNWSQVEQYADDVIAAIHIISMVSPDYFENFGE